MLLTHDDLWTDYLVAATIRWVKGDTLTLIAREKGNGNDIRCVLNSNGTLNIYRSWKGDYQLIGGPENVPNLLLTQDLQTFVEVIGTHVTCGINNTNVTTFLSPQLTSGGIGFMVSDNSTNNASIIIKNLNVINEIQ